ncbi:hypothetical protein Tco_1148573 [Tanacetum coccineum]
MVIEDPYDEDGDIEWVDDSTGGLRSLVREILLGRKEMSGNQTLVRGLVRLKDPLVKSSKKLGEVFPGEAGKNSPGKAWDIVGDIVEEKVSSTSESDRIIIGWGKT